MTVEDHEKLRALPAGLQSKLFTLPANSSADHFTESERAVLRKTFGPNWNKTVNVTANFQPPVDECKFRIKSKVETDDGWMLTGEWIQIDLAGELAGLKPGMTTIFFKREKEDDSKTEES